MLRRYPLAVILFTIFVDMLGIGILIPVIPQLFADPASAAYALAPGTSIERGFVLLGLLTALYPLMMFLSAPVLGQLSDRYGRRKVLAICLAGTASGYVLFALGILWKSLPLLFFSRILDGLTGGNIAVAQAAIADVTPPEQRAKNFGLMGAVFGLGFIAGPFLGGKLADPGVLPWFNAAVPFWFAAGLAALNLVSVLLFFPETRPQNAVRAALRWIQSLLNIRKAFSAGNLRALYATAFLMHVGFSFFVTFFSVYLLRHFGFNESRIGDYFAYMGLCIVLAQMLVVRAVAKRFSEYKVLAVSLGGVAVGVFAHSLPDAPIWLLLIAPFFAVMNGLTQANLSALISRNADPAAQGGALGIAASVQALAGAIPPLLSGYAAARLSIEAPILIASAIILASWVYFLVAYLPRRREAAA